MSGGMFIISEGGDLVSLAPTPFAKEVDFQRLIENHPELLSGDLIEPGAPRRWILIRSEMNVPMEADAVSGLSLDDLFVDQDGVPTLVEVKRASDSRLRREVVAQMLDYAANAVVYWPPSDLRSHFETRLENEGKNPDGELQDRLGLSPSDIEGFWQNVATNLRSGRIRMLFVADEIPAQLRTIVEFLNEQMSPAIVLALELRHFEGANLQTLVPVVFGQTERAIQEKRIGTARSNLTEAAFFETLKQHRTADVAAQLFKEAAIAGFSTRSTPSSLFVRCPNGSGDFIEPFAVRTSGMMEVYLHAKHMKAPFDTEQYRAELRHKFESIEGLNLSRAGTYPTAALDRFSSATIYGVRNVLSWIKDQVSLQVAVPE